MDSHQYEPSFLIHIFLQGIIDRIQILDHIQIILFYVYVYRDGTMIFNEI